MNETLTIYYLEPIFFFGGIFLHLGEVFFKTAEKEKKRIENEKKEF
jgi:hypothetical protein